jgi:hypothetical protein
MDKAVDVRLIEPARPWPDGHSEFLTVAVEPVLWAAGSLSLFANHGKSRSIVVRNTTWNCPKGRSTGFCTFFPERKSWAGMQPQV